MLDVGCGNGYYGWRLCGAGAASVVGIDPGQRHDDTPAHPGRLVREMRNVLAIPSPDQLLR